MQTIWEKPCAFTPSLICLDVCNLETQVNLVKESGTEILHVDILDGHFSPSMPLGLETVRQLRAKTDLAFDCHVMATDQTYFIDELLDIGVQQIVFQAETQPHIDYMLGHIHSKGVRAGIALKPDTPLSVLEYVLDKCDMILLMLINPGFAFLKGEAQVAYADRKIKDLRAMIDERGLNTKISIDGRVSFDNIKTYGKDMVDYFVLGTTCLDKENLPGSFSELYQLRNQILEEK